MDPHIYSIDFYKGVTIVRLEGSITFDTLKDTQDEFRAKTVGYSIKNILFDLTKVTNADSGGMAALVELLKYMKSHQKGDRIGLINTPQKVKDLLLITKIQSFISEFASEDEAIESLV
jgi:anti-anti-sigma factor